MASYDQIDPNAEEEKRDLMASDNPIEALKLRKEILWDFYVEHRTHARHTETLRSTVISMLIVASAGLVTLATYDKKLNPWDLPAAALLVGFGLLGIFFSLYHTEKILKHKVTAREYRSDLDTTVVVPLKGGQPIEDIRRRVADKFPVLSQASAGSAGSAATTNKFTHRVVRVIEGLEAPSSLILWTVLPLFISAIGLSLLLVILLQWQN